MLPAASLFTACLTLVVSAVAAQNYPDQNTRPYGDSGVRDRDSDRNESVTIPDRIPAGTKIKVRTNATIEVRERADHRIYTGTVTDDVTGENGNVLIPRGANAELMVTSDGEKNMAVDLESITVHGHRYMVAAETYDRARHTGLGANKRTGEYVGGGALLGSVLGAIAGGGKGAAIGAMAGEGARDGGAAIRRQGAVRVRG